MLGRLTVIGLLMLSVFTLVVAAQAMLPDEVSSYMQWARANPQKSFEVSAHPVAKDIYYNDAASEALMARSFPYAEGSIFIKERVDPATLMVTNLYTMRKVAGFDPDNGDWQYGVFERQDDGSFGNGWFSADNQAMCVGCHSGAADTDYTFLSYLP